MSPQRHWGIAEHDPPPILSPLLDSISFYFVLVHKAIKNTVTESNFYFAEGFIGRRLLQRVASIPEWGKFIALPPILCLTWVTWVDSDGSFAHADVSLCFEVPSEPSTAAIRV